MSGRKSWEVASVLDQTEAVREEIFNLHNNNINNSIKNIKKSINQINSIKNEIIVFELSGLSKDEFRDTFNVFSERLREIKSYFISMKNFESYVDEVKKEINSIKREIKKLNEKSADIREKIRNVNHYVTKEYNEAVEIKNRFNELKDNFRKLESKANEYNREVSNFLINSQNRKEEFEKLKEDFEELEKEAKRIKEIRDKAEELKKEIKSKFKNIDLEKSSKFLKDEFEELKKEINNYLNLSDEEVVKKYNEISSKIVKFTTKLEEIYREYIAKKEALSKEMEDIRNRAEEKVYVFIEDWAEDIDEKRNKFEYYDKYKGEKSFEKYNEMIKKANILLEEDKFEELEELLKEITKFYEDISNKADDLKEDIESSTHLALKIRDIMLDEVDFREAEVEIIDGNPINGFRIYCKNGDTIIFEKIKVESGEPIIKIDHIEKTPGTCGIRWKDMKKAFNDNGIPLVDITKNGISVIDGRASIKTREKDKSKARGNNV